MWKENTLQLKNLRIQITNKHVNAKGIWVIHVREFNWNTKSIGIPNESTEEQAKVTAIEMVKEFLTETLREVTELNT